jgi:DNA modification methylase
MQQHIPLNEIICGRNEIVLAAFPAECIDLAVTSPPYDGLRAYKGFEWDFDKTAAELYRVIKPGGVVVWVVADATVNGSESGTSFRQALAFMALGFRLHDTMIYRRDNPMPGEQPRYCQGFEFMFILSKGAPRVFNPLIEKSTNVGLLKSGQTQRNVDGSLKTHTGNGTLYKELKKRDNVWGYATGNGHTTLDQYAFDHGAMFPEKLAEDHILSWSNPGDVVLDPFVGSGTTPKMAIRHNRQFIGIDISPEYCALARRRIAAVDSVMMELFV